VQTDTENMVTFPGLVEVDQPLPFSRTPLSFCCVVKESGVKVIVAWDEGVIVGGEVRELIERIGRALEKSLSGLRVDGGHNFMGDVMVGSRGNKMLDAFKV